MRSVVVPDTATIELEIDARWAGRALLSVDNRTLELGAEQRLSVRRSEQEILLVVPHNISFYETLHSKMMWDVDVRN
jgi:NAD+ kinase